MGHTHTYKKRVLSGINFRGKCGGLFWLLLVYKLRPLNGLVLDRRQPGQIKNRCVVIPLFWQTLQMISRKKQIFFHFASTFSENFLGCSKRPLQRLDCKGQAQKVQTWNYLRFKSPSTKDQHVYMEKVSGKVAITIQIFVYWVGWYLFQLLKLGR